jgi:hypothetical protein
MGVLIGARGRFPRVGRGESEEVEGRVTASWLVDWLNIHLSPIWEYSSMWPLGHPHQVWSKSTPKWGRASTRGVGRPTSWALWIWASAHGLHLVCTSPWWQLLVLDNIFSIFSLKSSKSQSKFLQWINTKTVELNYNTGFEHSHFLNITDMLAHKIGGLQPSTTNHKCTQTCLYHYFILNRGLGSCPGAAARLWGWNLGRPLPQSSLWNPTSRIISVV